MTDTSDDEARDETAADDYEYDEAHGGGDTGPDVPAALQDETARNRELNPGG